jgi:hypothetical protein
MRNAYSILVGKPEGKRPLGVGLEDKIIMNFREIWREGGYWIHLAQDWDHCGVGNELAGSFKGGGFLE